MSSLHGTENLTTLCIFSCKRDNQIYTLNTVNRWMEKVSFTEYIKFQPNVSNLFLITSEKVLMKYRSICRLPDYFCYYYFVVFSGALVVGEGEEGAQLHQNYHHHLENKINIVSQLKALILQGQCNIQKYRQE